MDMIKQLVSFIIKLHGKIIIFDGYNTHGFSFEGFWVFSRFIYLFVVLGRQAAVGLI